MKKVKKWKIEVELWDYETPECGDFLIKNCIKDWIKDSLIKIEEIDIVKPAKFYNLKIRRIK